MSLNSSSINLWKQILGTSSSKFINTVGVILLISVLNYQFTVEEIGVFFFLFAIVDLLSNIAGGIGMAVRKRVSAREGKQSGYLTTAFLVTFAMQVGIAVAGLTAFSLIPDGLVPDAVSQVDLPLLGSSLLLLFTQSTAKVMINFNSGLGYPSRSEWLGRAMPGILFFVVTIMIVYLGYGLTYIFLAGSASYGLSALLLLISTRPDLTKTPTIQKLKSLIEFGKWSIPNKIVTDFYGGLDVIVLGFLVTSTAVGYYESGDNLAHLVFTIPYGVGAVISVKISGLQAEEKFDEIKNIIRDVIPVSVSIPVGALFLSIVFGEPILRLIYGGGFQGAYLFLLGLAVKEILLAYRKPIQDLNYGINKPEVPFYSNVSAILFNSITVIPLVFVMGGIGVVVSTVISEFIRLAVLWRQTTDHLGKIQFLPTITPFIVGAPTGALFLGINRYVQSGNVLFDLIQIVCFACIYLSVLYAINLRFQE